jgi:hypothetical protein
VSTAFDYKVTLVDDQESTCTAGRGRAGTCPEAAAYTLSYRYVTGPAGRETVRHFPACPGHAQAFAVKHGVRVPEVDGG